MEELSVNTYGSVGVGGDFGPRVWAQKNQNKTFG